MDLTKIGKNIAQKRKQNNLTQEALAERLGMTPQAISKWETGAGLPETPALVALADCLEASIDDLLGRYGPETDLFMETNQSPPKAKNLPFIPRVERWDPPEGCDMWYSFPAMIAAALCSVEAYESGGVDALAMDMLNLRYYDIMHVTGIGYGFLWNTPRHLIEELWHINDHRDMADRVMRYYGRNYLWLTKENSTPEEVRRVALWSIANGRPVVMENAGGMPEYDLITGYADGGDTLIGWSHCMECAVKTDEQRRFVNPARWDEIKDYRALIIGSRVPPSYTDADSVAFALETLNTSGPAAYFDYKKDKMYAGDAALDMWLAACDTPQNAAKLCKTNDIYSFALYKNTIHAAQSVAAYFKGLDARSDKKVHDIYSQINIGAMRLADSRRRMDDTPADAPGYLERCREHITSIKRHRADMRLWLRELDEHFKDRAAYGAAYRPYG